MNKQHPLMWNSSVDFPLSLLFFDPNGPELAPDPVNRARTMSDPFLPHSWA